MNILKNKVLIYVLKQLIYGILKLFVVLTIVFFLIKLMNIDVIDPKIPIETQKSLRHQLGLDLPIMQQYLNFLKSVVTLNFGNSWKLEDGIPVIQIISEKLPYSMILGGSAYLISIVIGFFSGSFLTRYVGKLPDTIGTVTMLLIQSVPLFVIGALFISIGMLIGIPITFSSEEILSWFLPIFVLSIVLGSSFTKSFRFYLIDVYTQEYITTARAKGLSEQKVLAKHARRNALVPMLEPLIATLLGIIVGTVSIERLFNIPGIGNLLLSAVSAMDQPVVLAMVTILTIISISSMTIVNILYTFVDPRIKLGE